MADAPYQVGYNIGAKVDYSQITEANRVAGEFAKTMERVRKQQEMMSHGSAGSMADQMKSAKRETDSYASSSKQATRQQEQLNSQVELTGKRVRSAGDSAGSAAGDMQKLQKSVESIADSASKTFQVVSDNLDKVGEHSQSTRKKLDRLNETGKKFKDVGYSMLPASAALGASFVKGANDATKLQHEYTIVKNLIKTGGESTAASVENSRKMMEQGRSMSMKYNTSQLDIAKGYEELVRRGYDSNQALAAQQTYLQGAKASGDSYKDVVSGAASAIEAFGLKSSNANTMMLNTKKTVNSMAYAADKTAASFKDMSDAMQYAGPNAHAANQSLSMTSSAIGILSNAHIEGSSAGTALRQIYKRLVSPPTKGAGANALDSMGLSSKDFLDAKKNLLPLDQVFEKLNSHMKGMSSTQKGGIYSALFGAEASSASVVLGKNVKELSSLNAETAKSYKQGGKGYVAGLSDKNMKSWQNQLGQFKQGIDDLGMSFARSILPTLTPMVTGLNKMVKAFGNLPDPMKKAIAYGTAFAALAGPLTIGAGAFMTSASTLKTAFIGSKTSGGGSTGGLLSKIGGVKGARGMANMPTTASKVVGAGVGVGVAASAGLDIYSALKSKNDTTKYKKFGQGIGTAVGGGIGMYFGGPAGAAVGATIGKVVGGWVGKATHAFSKTKLGQSIGKSVAKLGPILQKSTKKIPKIFSSTWKSVKKSTASAASSLGKAFNKAAPVVGKAAAAIGRKLKPVAKFYKTFLVVGLQTAVKVMGHVLTGAVGVVAALVKGIAKSFSGLAKVFSGTVGLISDIFSGHWKKLWGDAKDIFDGFKTSISASVHAVGDVFNTVFGTISKVVGDVLGGFSKFVDKLNGSGSAQGYFTSGTKLKSKKSSSKPKINVQTGFAHAAGGLIGSQHTALVGEGGTELAYTVGGQKARLLGANGPTLAKVKPGERILNARDTNKVLKGGLGHVLPGYAAGTAKLGTQQSTKSLDKFSKQSSSDWSKTQKATSKSTKKIKKTTVADYDDLQKGSAKQLSQLVAGNASSWKSINSQTGKRTDSLRKSTVANFNSLQIGSQKQMDQLQSGVIASAKDAAVGFGKEMGRMKGYANSAMGGAVGQLNRGITGIDSVLGQFGGNNNVIKTIKYANGSNGKLATNQMAMINDATTGPRQEAVIRGNRWFLPKGNNRILPLQKGDQVLNGHQTQKLGLTHYAKGSGVSDSALTKIAESGEKNPAATFAKDFTDKMKSTGTDLQKGSVDLEKNASTRYGVPWTKAMFSVINDEINGGGSGTRAAVLKYAKEHFTGKPYRLGGRGPTYYDCAAMVASALKHFGVDIGWTTTAMQASSGVSRMGQNPAKTVPGDIVLWGHGTGAGGHVGFVDRPGTSSSNTITFNETPPRARDTTVAYHTSLPLDGYYRIKALKDKKTASQSAGDQLKALAKKELGSKSLSWISSNLGVSDSGSYGGTSAKPTGDHAHWLEQAGMPKSWWPWVSKILSKENRGWDPTLHNGQGSSAYGIPQALPGSKMASAGSDWRTNPITQLKWMKSYIKTVYGNAEHAWHIHQSRGWYANGGWAAKNALNIFGEVPGEPEVAINPARPSADGLIDQTIQARAQVDKSSPSADFLKAAKSAKVSQVGRVIKPEIKININGDISDERMLKKTEDMINRALTSAFSKIDDEYGLDGSVY